MTTFSEFSNGASASSQVIDLSQQFHIVEQRDECHEIWIRNFLTLTTASNLQAHDTMFR